MGAYGRERKNISYLAPRTEDYVKWLLIPSILSIFTCGIGGLILMVVWACSNEQIARRNLMRANLLIMALPFIILIALVILNAIQPPGTMPFQPPIR